MEQGWSHQDLKERNHTGKDYLCLSFCICRVETDSRTRLDRKEVLSPVEASSDNWPLYLQLAC